MHNLKKNTMNRQSFEKYELSEVKEKELWENSLIIFDTSALIDFYYYPKETREDIFSKIFPKLAGRLWIPNHVQFEYLKNRKGIIEKPIKESYQPIKDEKLKELISAKSLILRITEQIKKETLKPEKHPFLPQEKIDKFIDFTKEIDERVKQFEKDLKEEIEKQENEIKSLNENDTILEAFENNFKVGDEFSFSQIMEIVSEGKLRYEFEIPPGYKDLKEKEGTQIFGDLIVWKQILAYSKEQNKSVIFICNDLKIDWCYKNSRNRIESPRFELIKEFIDNSNQKFWMYDQSQFIYKSKEILEIDFADAKIKEISKIINNRNYENLIYECGNCGSEVEIPFEELELYFDCIETSDRGMGPENHYQFENYVQCSNCIEDALLTLDIWEYPIGAHNTDEIEIDNGKIIQSPDFVEFFWDNYYDEPDEDIFRDR